MTTKGEIPEEVWKKIKGLLQRKENGEDISRDDVDLVLYGCNFGPRKQAWKRLEPDEESRHSDSAFIRKTAKDQDLDDKIVQIIIEKGIKDFDIPEISREQIQKVFEHQPQHIEAAWKFIQMCKQDEFATLYESLEIIETGRYNCEFHICRKKNKVKNKMFAAKKGYEVVYSDAEQTIHVYSSVQNQKVARYRKHLKSAKSTVIVIELCGGSVEQLIPPKCRPSNNEAFQKIEPINPESGSFSHKSFLEHFQIETKEIMRQSVKGIKYLHTRKPDVIVHGGIKPSNLLLFIATDQAKTRIKVADFGLSRKDDETNLFLPPEHVLGIKPTIETDIFSLGLTFFYIMTNGSHVYGDDPDLHKTCLKEERRLTFNEALPLRNRKEGSREDFLTDEYKVTTCDMIRRMLKFESYERFSIHDVTAHPTFWDSKKKVEFFLEAYKTIEALEKENWRLLKKMDLNCYDNKLTRDGGRGKSMFKITADDIPKVCQYVPDWIPGNNLFSFNKRKPVSELLRIMRHKTSHGRMKDGEKVLFCKKDSKGNYSHQLDWDKFLFEFTGKFPQLLVHLYEKFKGNDLFEKGTFYPSPRV